MEMAEYELGPTEYDQALKHCRENGEAAPWLHVMPVDGRRDINLAATDLAPGATWRFGDAFVTFVAGHQDPHEGLGEAEMNNAGSIIVKLTYNGRSILLTGDAVGRHNDQVEDTCIATEAKALEIQSEWPIASSLHADSIGAEFVGFQPLLSACIRRKAL
jgi:beta-lactamase superfamily II metal-dependent hydrolase